MTERILTRIFCSKLQSPHQIGVVGKDEDGVFLRYQQEVDGKGGAHSAVETTWRRAGYDGSEGSNAWCTVCKRSLPIFLSSLVDMNPHPKSVRLDNEGMWDDPLGVLERKRQARLR